MEESLSLMTDPAPFQLVAVAPTYNNARTLMDILTRIEAQDIPLIVVNDGSTDATGQLLSQWEGIPHKSLVSVVNHERNRGKAAALRSGFAAAATAGYTHALTIDTDGQLDPEQIPAVRNIAQLWPQSLVVGNRDEQAHDYPARSRIGRRFSNFMVWMESGVRVEDSQCGFRVYPLDFVNAVKCRAGHFGFETEIITRAGWAGCPVTHAPVRCRYLPAGQRVSHFRPWLDSLRALLMHALLLLRALSPWPRHPRCRAPADAAPSAQSLWRKAWTWIDPRLAWRQLNEDQLGRTACATGLALGVFIANLPLYGLQTLLSLYSARRLHLNPLSVLLGSQLSTPPIGPLLGIAAVTLGHLLLHGSLPVAANFNIAHLGWKAVLGPVLLDWAVGGLLMGLILGAIVFAIAICSINLIIRPENPPIRLDADQIA
jgi:uncharacterized protein (DUF2062 family)